MKVSKGWVAVLVVAAVIIVDQIVKLWVKTHMYLGEDIRITDWFYIYFIQNPGMAFGMEMGSKLFLSIFRIIAVVGLIYYMTRLKNREAVPYGYMVCVALITAGALGNIIDCVCYGLLFNNPLPPEVATMLPEGGGYASLLHGQVVDMLYFPLFSFYWPQWMPWIGGEHFIFFHPVFNIADAAITVGILILIIFYAKYLGELKKE